MYTQLDRSKSRSLGYSGEDLLYDFFTASGSTVTKSIDPYDQHKDLVIDGRMTEIKTEVLYRKFGSNRSPAFTIPISGGSYIRKNQLNKCVNVDRLIFIKRPSNDDPVIRIYEAPKLGSRFFEIYQNPKDNRIVAGFYLDTLTEIGVITDSAKVSYFMEERKW